jgi:hypothetical protein
MGKDNIWLVHKKVNAMKGTMTYDELVEMACTILDHHGETKELIERIHNNEVRPVSKEDFDVWVEQNCSSDGRIIT